MRTAVEPSRGRATIRAIAFLCLGGANEALAHQDRPDISDRFNPSGPRAGPAEKSRARRRWAAAERRPAHRQGVSAGLEPGKGRSADPSLHSGQALEAGTRGALGAQRRCRAKNPALRPQNVIGGTAGGHSSEHVRKSL